MGVTIAELLGMSKSARELIKNEITAKRVPIVEVKKTTIEDIPDEDNQPSRARKTLPGVKVLVSTFPIGRMPSGSTYISDPIEQFLVEGGDQGNLARIMVAKESQSLRAIYPTINGVVEYECVVNGGLQIVSMALKVAQELGLSWDPDIKIQLQSANKTVDHSMGLAKNVSFLFGMIMIYLQVHIIRDPAYQVLLGRPFDVIMESNIQNLADGRQIITLRDPNSGVVSTLTTFEHGKPKYKQVAEIPAPMAGIQQDSRI